MTQALPQVALGSSRLVRFLSDLSVSGAQVSHQKFTERLGDLIDFSDSISIAEAHGEMPGLETAEQPEPAEDIVAEFIRARNAIVQSAIRSFVPGAGPTRIRWPNAETMAPRDMAQACAPYLKFYSRMQGEIDSRVRGLQHRTRTLTLTMSGDLARLGTLDAVLSDALAGHLRRYFAAIPRLLARRQEQLFAEYLADLGTGADPLPRWQETREQFRREAQGLLLAEIEARLLPALGLIEAINEEAQSPA